MSRTGQCALCGEGVTYNPETFAWRHDRRPEDDHAPVPTNVAYPTKSVVKARRTKTNG